jgi:hypothetical protein
MMRPVEYLVFEFPGNQFKGKIVPALIELTERGTVRIIDLLFVKKDKDLMRCINSTSVSSLAEDCATGK